MAARISHAARLPFDYLRKPHYELYENNLLGERHIRYGGYDWQLIEDHWQNLMQVVLSIHKGKVLPSWLLQKLRTDNPKNKLYQAFRELGCVLRTMFLLEYVSNTQLRREIRAATT
jgi:TnpA family transposase